MVEEEFAPCWESFGVEQLGGCWARIGQWIVCIWSPFLRLSQPMLLRGWPVRLLLARLLEPERQAFQWVCGLYSFETHTQQTLSYRGKVLCSSISGAMIPIFTNSQGGWEKVGMLNVDV